APLVEWNDLNSTSVPPVGVQFWLSGRFSPGGGPGSLSANFRDTNSQPHVIETPPFAITNALSPTNSAWQHVALSYDAATFTARLYVNCNLALPQAVAGDKYGADRRHPDYKFYQCDRLGGDWPAMGDQHY